jgi:hypothetical protein
MPVVFLDHNQYVELSTLTLKLIKKFKKHYTKNCYNDVPNKNKKVLEHGK